MAATLKLKERDARQLMKKLSGNTKPKVRKKAVPKPPKKNIFWMSEKEFSKYIKDAFEFDDDLQLHRRNVGRATFGNRSVKFGEAGQSDFFGIVKKWTCLCCRRVREGVTIEIEAKGISKDGKRGVQSPAQKKWQAEVERNNGIYILLHPVPEDLLGGIRMRVWRLIDRKMCTCYEKMKGNLND